MRFSVSGQGEPIVVLLSGGEAPIDSWDCVSSDLAKLGTVFAYDRLGVGGSDWPIEPQTSHVVVTALRTLLAKVGLPPPYILCAHSLGGLYANYFARQYPAEVSRVVFIESAHPDEHRMQDQFKGPVIQTLGRLATISSRLFGQQPHPEIESIAETVKQLETSPPFPDIPIGVLTGGKRSFMVPKQAYEHHRMKQLELAALSSNAVHVIAECGHFPQMTQAHTIVDLVQSVMQRS